MGDSDKRETRAFPGDHYGEESVQGFISMRYGGRASASINAPEELPRAQ